MDGTSRAQRRRLARAAVEEAAMAALELRRLKGWFDSRVRTLYTRDPIWAPADELALTFVNIVFSRIRRRLFPLDADVFRRIQAACYAVKKVTGMRADFRRLRDGCHRVRIGDGDGGAFPGGRFLCPAGDVEANAMEGLVFHLSEYLVARR